jgi:hypothetical protein
MGEAYGRRLSFSPPRRWINDFLHFAQQVPTVPVQKRMTVAALKAAREECDSRPSWVSLFAKAYALVAAKRPELRRVYLGFPWAHQYEHPTSVVSIAIERRVADEDCVFFTQIRGPEELTPEQLDRVLAHCKEVPIEQFGIFRRAMRISRLPGPLRRLSWWMALNLSGYYRARNVGTFGVSVYSSLGAESLHPLSLMTTTLNYGVIADDGTVDVRIIYDHRILNGATVARTLNELEETLNHQLPPLLVSPPRPSLSSSRPVPAKG